MQFYMLIFALLYLIPELSRINSQAFDLTPSRHIAKVTLIVLRLPKTDTKVFGPVEFEFPAFEVIRLPKTGKNRRKPVNLRG